MDDYLNEDLDLKRRAWNFHFMDKRKNNKFKFLKKKNKKYVVKWIKQKDSDHLFEKWVQIKTLNENYSSEEQKEQEQEPEQQNDKKIKNIVVGINDKNNQTRRSSRLNLQTILNENVKKNYADPSSDSSFETNENDK